MPRHESGRRRREQRNFLYQESSLWGVAAGVIVLLCVIALAIAILMSEA